MSVVMPPAGSENKVCKTVSVSRGFRPSLELRDCGRMILPQLLKKQVVCLGSVKSLTPRHKNTRGQSIQRYDVRNYVSGESAWVERFWSPINVSVFGCGGREITHLVHQVEDVTQAVLLEQWINEEREITRERLEALELMRQELLESQSMLEKARRQLFLILQSPGSREFLSRKSRDSLGFRTSPVAGARTMKLP